MSNNIKRIILVGLMILSVVMIALTFNYAKKHISSSENREHEYGRMHEVDREEFLKEGIDAKDLVSGYDFEEHDDHDGKKERKRDFSVSCVFFMGVWCLVFVSSFGYLIKSKMVTENVFTSTNRVIIFIIVSIILSMIMTFLVAYLGDEYYLDKYKDMGIINNIFDES